MTAGASSPWRRLAWFLALWCAGTAALALLAFAVRALLAA